MYDQTRPGSIETRTQLTMLNEPRRHTNAISLCTANAQLYEQYSAGVRRQVQTLRTVLQSLQVKSQDRTWLKNQTSGDLDDNRIIDGLTGEKSIYKKRGDMDPEIGAPQEKPKRLKVVVDVSGSMSGSVRCRQKNFFFV